jgi:hypothetical protein
MRELSLFCQPRPAFLGLSGAPRDAGPALSKDAAESKERRDETAQVMRSDAMVVIMVMIVCDDEEVLLLLRGERHDITKAVCGVLRRPQRARPCSVEQRNCRSNARTNRLSAD